MAEEKTEAKAEQWLPIKREELVLEIAALNTLLGEWGRMQYVLIDKAAAAQLRMQALYKKLLAAER